MASWALLPKELLYLVFTTLDCKNLSSAVCVNRSWNVLSSSENIWREAIINDSLPHNYSYSQKNVSWRQIVQRHIESKRNILKKRCVQFTLGTRTPTAKTGCDIVLRNKTASGKYCLLVWESITSPWNSYTEHSHIATELWDTEMRIKIRTYEDLRQNEDQNIDLVLFNDYLLKDLAYEGKVLSYARLDPESEEKIEFKLLPLEHPASLPLKRNEAKNSSLVATTWLVGQEMFTQVYDLRTGSQISEGWSFPMGNVVQFTGDNILFQIHDPGYYLVLDVAHNKEIYFEEPEIYGTCAALAGDELWILRAPKKTMTKLNIYTKERQQFTIDREITNAPKIQIFDGMIWVHGWRQGSSIEIFEIRGTKMQFLTRLAVPNRDGTEIKQLPNGSISLLNTSYAHILSFRDEDVELPIQVLQIEPNGQNKNIDMLQGDLNALILNQSPYLYSVTSQIVQRDENGRYCIIFMHTQEVHKSKAVNPFAETAKKWLKDVSYAKTAIFQLALLDLQTVNLSLAPPMQPIARGTCWAFYERKLLSGGWQKSIPDDGWKSFKTKLGLK